MIEIIKDFIISLPTYFNSSLTIFIAKSLTIIVILAAGNFLKKFVLKSVKNICKMRRVNNHARLILEKVSRYSITTLTYILALQNLGIEVSPLITALGISGVALSFGMKDTISNIIAGILIMAYQQIKVGDHIKIKDWQGEVVDINIRYTTLKTDGMKVFIPNSVLYTTTVAIIDKDKI